MEKKSITIGAINNSVICHLEHIAQPKLKVYFLKNVLITITDEIKRG